MIKKINIMYNFANFKMIKIKIKMIKIMMIKMIMNKKMMKKWYIIHFLQIK